MTNNTRSTCDDVNVKASDSKPSIQINNDSEINATETEQVKLELKSEATNDKNVVKIAATDKE